MIRQLLILFLAFSLTGCQYIWPVKAMSGPKAEVDKTTTQEVPAKTHRKKIIIRVRKRNSSSPTTQPALIKEITK